MRLWDRAQSQFLAIRLLGKISPTGSWPSYPPRPGQLHLLPGQLGILCIECTVTMKGNQGLSFSEESDTWV